MSRQHVTYSIKGQLVTTLAITCFFAAFFILFGPFVSILDSVDCSASDVFNVEKISPSPTHPSNCILMGHLDNAPGSTTNLTLVSSLNCLTSYLGSKIPVCYNGFSKKIDGFRINTFATTTVFISVYKLVLVILMVGLLLWTACSLLAGLDTFSAQSSFLERLT